MFILSIIIPTWVFISVLIYFPMEAGNNIPPPTLTSMQISAIERRHVLPLHSNVGRTAGGCQQRYLIANGTINVKDMISHSVRQGDIQKGFDIAGKFDEGDSPGT